MNTLPTLIQAAMANNMTAGEPIRSPKPTGQRVIPMNINTETVNALPIAHLANASDRMSLKFW
jgi:hypothetical protein